MRTIYLVYYDDGDCIGAYTELSLAEQAVIDRCELLGTPASGYFIDAMTLYGH